MQCLQSVNLHVDVASSGCCDVPQNVFDVQSIQCQSCDMMKEYNDTCSSWCCLGSVSISGACTLQERERRGLSRSNEIVGKTSRTCVF